MASSVYPSRFTHRHEKERERERIIQDLETLMLVLSHWCVELRLDLLHVQDLLYNSDDVLCAR